jgi:ribose-phosphate pyrophosphokinase
MAKYIAFYIVALNHNISVTQLLDPHQKIKQLLENHR